jgi:transcriptional regulator with XRE-family HTH domain
MKFAANLKRIRLSKKLSQEELAHACGFPGQSRVGNYEAGTREPSTDEISLIAKVLEVGVGELFGEPPASVSKSQETGLDPVMLGETAAAVSRYYDRAGQMFKLEAEPERFLQAYAARRALPAKPSSAEMFEFGLTVAAIFESHGGGGDGGGTARGKNLPTDGGAGRNVARRKGKEARS